MDANTHHRTRLPIRAKLATTVADAAASVSRLAGKGDGSVIGGRPYAAPDEALRPNLGPPPSRPDWRRGARS